ncbi:DUF4424 family protein [Pinisolibacter aquiterrae]|uniref:DUF4424 family protein n=1 Tax=Pinisolibacter aquiterrae TaxID=2815579 RepID=UPI001C3DDAFD|nr:DUF4424 domain-containing protein [Pinisolibacter aquiterrae]MCC8234614.1 DUF4424 domain-containing protein [Pinisolibacter aquiterrae]
MTLRFDTVLLASALAVAAVPADANDSMAETAIGGLTLTKSADVVMESEDLFVSEEKVTVDYVFTNTSSKDLETLVAFPLPDVVNGPEDVHRPDFAKELEFKTTIDGRPAELTLVQAALVNGTDVTAQVRAAGLPLSMDPEFEAKVKALAPDVRNGLVAAGALKNDGDDANPYWNAHWTTKTTVTRTQVFPAGKSIRVSHAYKPFVGGSVGSILKPDLRNQPDLAKEVAAYRAKFCIDDAFVKGFDAARGKDEDALQSDLWIGYVLTSGANWSGPIRHFRLVVDKGDPKNLVSFCATGVKKIAPTRFEVVYENFTPKQDLDVLIVRPPSKM